MVPSSLPKVAFMHFRATIACRADNNLETIDYGSCPGGRGGLTMDELLDEVPEVKKVVEIVEVYQPGTFLSDAKNLLKATKWIKSLDPDMPVVVSHGTSAVADIAFFFDVTLDKSAPVILTGAMRPLSAITCDGHYNLVQACALAVHPSARNRGVMLCFNDRITPAFYGLKTSANRMDTFKCFEAGHLGLMNNLTPHFFYEPAKATGKPFFEIDNLNDLPKAVLLVCYMDMDMGELESKCNDKEVKGIVIAGSGNASVPAAWREKTVQKGAAGFPIVRTSLHADSHSSPHSMTRNQIASGDLGPFKSLILLRLALAKFGQDIEKIREAFGTNFEKASLP